MQIIGNYNSTKNELDYTMTDESVKNEFDEIHIFSKLTLQDKLRATYLFFFQCAAYQAILMDNTDKLIAETILNMNTGI